VVSFSYDRGADDGREAKDVIEIQRMARRWSRIATTLENMERVVKEYAATVPHLPLWVKPNAGVPRMDIETEQGVYDMGPGDMAAYALKYVELGAKVVGGCCGNTPEHVAAIARAVRKQSVISG
jgi:S-methylmethionine-dependent homocysteine/selenocysteine methylase